MNKLEKSRGDTIVEVLIALVVLTTVMVGAYVSANHAQNSSQASQERAEANKISESQIERLKGLLANPTSTVPSVPFCIKTDNSDFQLFGSSDPDPFAQSLESDTLPYPADCGNIDGRYNVAIMENGNTYSFIVRWYRAGGGRNQINMYYRVH